jgi:hypothetical protein
MSDYKSLNEEQRKVWNAVLIGVGVGVGVGVGAGAGV